MWVLLWVQLMATQNVNHFHIGNYSKEVDCQSAMSAAAVLVTSKNESIACLYVDINDIRN